MTRPAPHPASPPPVTRGARTYDVSDLPAVGFGPRSVMWWGAVAFMLIEGTTLATSIGTYLYLSGVEPQWPPPRTLQPSLLVPVLKSIVLAVSLLPSLLASRAARRFEFRRMRRLEVVMAVAGVVAVALQFLELRSVNVRWDSHAYGSAVWAVLIAYFFIISTDVLETVVFTVLLYLGPVKESHFPDVSDNSAYWTFCALTGILTSVFLTLVPRL